MPPLTPEGWAASVVGLGELIGNQRSRMGVMKPSLSRRGRAEPRATTIANNLPQSFRAVCGQACSRFFDKRWFAGADAVAVGTGERRLRPFIRSETGGTTNADKGKAQAQQKSRYMGTRFARRKRGMCRVGEFIMSKSGQPATNADQGGQRPAKAPKDSATNGRSTGMGRGSCVNTKPAAPVSAPSKKK